MWSALVPGRRTRGSVGSRSKGATQLFGDLYPDTLHRVSPYGWGIGWSDAGRFIFIEAIANERHQPHAMVASVHFISAFGCEWCSAGLSLCCRAAWSVRECGRVPPPIGVRRSEYADQSTPIRVRRSEYKARPPGERWRGQIAAAHPLPHLDTTAQNGHNREVGRRVPAGDAWAAISVDESKVRAR